jgi:hypothetical protein
MAFPLASLDYDPIPIVTCGTVRGILSDEEARLVLLRQEKEAEALKVLNDEYQVLLEEERRTQVGRPLWGGIDLHGHYWNLWVPCLPQKRTL